VLRSRNEGTERLVETLGASAPFTGGGAATADPEPPSGAA